LLDFLDIELGEALMNTLECSNTAPPFFRHYSKLKKGQRARVEVVQAMETPNSNSRKIEKQTYICQVCGTENVSVRVTITHPIITATMQPE
jgi:hypothetical protein